MGKIYTVAVEFTYDCYIRSFFGFRSKFICKEIEYYWQRPIFAIDENEAIKIYQGSNNTEKCSLYVPYGSDTKNVVKKVVIIEKDYTIEELQKKMNSKEFLQYCRQELGLDQTVNILTK